MYKIQDAHSFWNWLYFVVLILVRLKTHFTTRAFYVSQGKVLGENGSNITFSKFSSLVLTL